MKIDSIVNRYLIKEMIPPFLINLVFFTFIFLIAKMLDLTDLVVNYSVSLFDILLILFFSLPQFLEFVIPMSVMLAVLLAFLRLSSDNEMTALKAGGVSLYSLLPPVLLFSLLGFELTGFMSIYGLPWGRLAAKELTYKSVASNISIGMRERRFNDSFEGVMLYIDKIDKKNNELLNVFIEDKRTKDIVSTVVAPRGKLFSDKDKLSYQLRLYKGMVNQVNPSDKSGHIIKFDTYDIFLAIKETMSIEKSAQKDEKEMKISELMRHTASGKNKDLQYYEMLLELHKKFSLPFACFALGVIAIPLGVRFRSVRRSFGLGLGGIFFLLYYFLMAIGVILGENGTVHPGIGMWLPNIVLGGIGIFLLIKASKEHNVGGEGLFNRMRNLFVR